MPEYDSLDEFRDPLTYDIECDEVVEELSLIEREAARMGGPVLDVACGTGRTALRLAARGYAVTGVDLVPEMVARGREKAATQGVAVEWVVADARSFALGKRFGCTYLVGNAFQFFYTRADQEGLLARVREHQHPGGVFIFDTRNPSPANLSEHRTRLPDHYTLPEGARLAISHEQPIYDPLAQVQHHTAHYIWTRQDEQTTTKIKRTALRYTFPQELEALLHYNGFRLTARYGDWQCAPLAADSPEQVVVCERR